MRTLTSVLLTLVATCCACAADPPTAEQVHDLSLLVSRDRPCVWPLGMTPLAIVPTRTFAESAEHRDMLIIDEHTGTQWDAPAHFVPPPDSGLPGAGPQGLITGEKVPAWQFCGEACVIDVTPARDRAANGSSFLIEPAVVVAWEQRHRRLGAGDVVLFRSGYTDAYYQPFPEGERFVATALRQETPGWPAPTPATMELLAERGVRTLGLDGASMGPLPDLAVATHQAGGKHGMVWVECATNLGQLPETGAFFAMLPAKHAGGSGGECRCVAITEPELAAALIARARARNVVDLSVTLDEDYPVTWTGAGPGEEASRYLGKTLNAFDKARGPYFARTHVLDSFVGTHLVLPSFTLPAEGLDRGRLAPPIRESLARFESAHGALGHSDLTTERAPLHDLMGRAHVIDVRELIGTTAESAWPASPQITLDLVKRHEQRRPIQRGEVVLFYSGYSDQHFQRLPEAPAVDRMFAAPLAGKAEGWPAPSPEVLDYLADRGVRCVGTDGPTLGGVERELARERYWEAGRRGLLIVEYLTGLGELLEHDAFFLFAPIKIAGTRGGYGRAIALRSGE